MGSFGSSDYPKTHSSWEINRNYEKKDILNRLGTLGTFWAWAKKFFLSVWSYFLRKKGGERFFMAVVFNFVARPRGPEVLNF